jgi:hypothetical protein
MKMLLKDQAIAIDIAGKKKSYSMLRYFSKPLLLPGKYDRNGNNFYKTSCCLSMLIANSFS